MKLRKPALGAIFLVALLVSYSCDLSISIDGGSSVYADNVVVVDDNITSATTWIAGKVYYLPSTVYVGGGATLTIQAGTVVKFGAGSSLIIEDGSNLNAPGTFDNPIFFTSIKDSLAEVGGDSILNDGSTAPAPGDWYYVWMTTGSGANMSYCTIRYAGREEYAAVFVDGTATIDSCTFNDNFCGRPTSSGEAALDARNASTGTTITNNVFYDNTWPLAVPSYLSIGSTNAFEYFDGTSTRTNTHQAIFVDNDGINTAVSWTETDVSFVVYPNSSLYVEAGGSLTTANGVVVKMIGSGANIYFEDGSGHTLNSAVFTEYRDDAHGGDTNADGSASSPTAGYWTGLYNAATDTFITTNVFYASNSW